MQICATDPQLTPSRSGLSDWESDWVRVPAGVVVVRPRPPWRGRGPVQAETRATRGRSAGTERFREEELGHLILSLDFGFAITLYGPTNRVVVPTKVVG
jgi:hypothetical protein